MGIGGTPQLGIAGLSYAHYYRPPEPAVALGAAVRATGAAARCRASGCRASLRDGSHTFRSAPCPVSRPPSRALQVCAGGYPVHRPDRRTAVICAVGGHVGFGPAERVGILAVRPAASRCRKLQEIEIERVRSARQWRRLPQLGRGWRLFNRARCNALRFFGCRPFCLGRPRWRRWMLAEPQAIGAPDDGIARRAGSQLFELERDDGCRFPFPPQAGEQRIGG